MIADFNQTRDIATVEFIDLQPIDDPAEQERLNRLLRRPDDRRKPTKAKTDKANGHSKSKKRSISTRNQAKGKKKSGRNR